MILVVNSAMEMNVHIPVLVKVVGISAVELIVLILVAVIVAE